VSIIEALKSANARNHSVNSFSSQSKNLSAIIRGFKGSVTRNARNINPEFKWQERFHDIIIRDGKAFDNIQNYICMNPNNWREDTFYKN
jgi:putative transposase